MQERGCKCGAHVSGNIKIKWHVLDELDSLFNSKFGITMYKNNYGRYLTHL